MEDGMAVNVELLNKVMEHIEAHPEEHDQDQWAQLADCGTKYCFAGHAAFMCGWTPIFDPDNTAAFCTSPDGDDSVPIESVARDLLGVTILQAEFLFYECGTADELRACVDKLISGRL
jgi:hypothetical protein